MMLGELVYLAFLTETTLKQWVRSKHLCITTSDAEFYKTKTEWKSCVI